MSDLPKPVKPQGISEEEWQVYLNTDILKMDPALLARVRAARGGKGHVPEENVARYTRLRELSHLLSRMGNMVSGLGESEDANTLWALGGKYKRMANELRDPPIRPAGGNE